MYVHIIRFPLDWDCMWVIFYPSFDLVFLGTNAWFIAPPEYWSVSLAAQWVPLHNIKKYVGGKQKVKSLLFNFFVHVGSQTVCTVNFSAVKLDCDGVCDSSVAGLTHCSESCVPRSRSRKPSWLSVNPSPLAPGLVTATSLQDGRLGSYCLRCHFC